jgi:8-oxo-dGTP diphosphatase
MRKRVASAVIRQGARVLLARRDERSDYAGAWECSGGKVEDGESDQQALARECSEELGVKVLVGEVVGQVELDPPLTKVPLLVTFYACTLLEGEPRPITAAELRAFSLEEMLQLPLMPANKALLPQVALYLQQGAQQVARAQLQEAERAALDVRQRLEELQERFDAQEAMALRWRRALELVKDGGGPAHDDQLALEWLQERLR